jgi:hypothetical protein
VVQDRCWTLLLSYFQSVQRPQSFCHVYGRVGIVLLGRSAYEEADVPATYQLGSLVSFDVHCPVKPEPIPIQTVKRLRVLGLLPITRTWRHDLCPVTWLPGTRLRRAWIRWVWAPRCPRSSAITITCIIPGVIVCRHARAYHIIKLCV